MIKYVMTKYDNYIICRNFCYEKMETWSYVNHNLIGHCVYHMDTYFFNIFFTHEFFSICSCLIPYLVFPCIYMRLNITREFEIRTKNLKWTVSTTQESYQIPSKIFMLITIS